MLACSAMTGQTFDLALAMHLNYFLTFFSFAATTFSLSLSKFMAWEHLLMIGKLSWEQKERLFNFFVGWVGPETQACLKRFIASISARYLDTNWLAWNVLWKVIGHLLVQVFKAFIVFNICGNLSFLLCHQGAFKISYSQQVVEI